MIIVNPWHRILYPEMLVDAIERIEWAARIAYKSEGKIKEGSGIKLVRSILSRDPPHESVLEHVSCSVVFGTSRGVTHELVRHRLASFTQESTRYCRYNHGITVVRGCSSEWIGWESSMLEAEANYIAALNAGMKPEQARGVLPNDVLAKIVMTANLREWRHVFRLRCDRAAHPDMRALMIPLRDELRGLVPIVFD